MPQPIPETTSSSSIEKENLILAFEENICNLRKTTSIKFHDYIEKYNKDFIMFVIEYCDESGIKSFAGFKTVIDSYIKKKIFTREDMLKDIEKFRAKKKNNINKKPIKKSNYNKTDSFIDFEQRNYTKEEFKQFEEELRGNHDLDLNEDILKRYPNLEIE